MDFKGEIKKVFISIWIAYLMLIFLSLTTIPFGSPIILMIITIVAIPTALLFSIFIGPLLAFTYTKVGNINNISICSLSTFFGSILSYLASILILSSNHMNSVVIGSLMGFLVGISYCYINKKNRGSRSA